MKRTHLVAMSLGLAVGISFTMAHVRSDAPKKPDEGKKVDEDVAPLAWSIQE